MNRYWGGWREYRYGPKKPVTLPRIYKGEARTFMVDETKALLKRWRQSPFEYEGTVRHGLRSGLCLAGRRWQTADAEAGAIVAESLRLMGAERPSWAEGQPHYTAPRENCSWCWSALDDYQQARGDRFCSTVCAKSAMEKRDYEDIVQRDKVGLNAYHLVKRERTVPRPCQRCGRMFRNNDPTAKFCTTRCYADSMRVFHPMACEACGTSFIPEKHQQTCCSIACAGKVRIARFRATRPEVACVKCGSRFRPANATSMFCSRECRSFIYRGESVIRDAVRTGKVIKLTPAIFDYMFRRAA